MSGRTFAEDLARAASEDPERIVLITPEGPVSAAALDRAASNIAGGLKAAGVRRGDRVAVVMPNGRQAAAAIYGVLRAGAGFSPVNPSIKHDRLALMLSDLQAAAVICDGDRAELVRGAAGPDVRVIDDVDAVRAEPEEGPVVLESDLAAVIYTSGSTGDAKGVTLTHRNMTFVADSNIEYLEVTAADRILCVLPLSFNYGLYHLFMSVRTGATLVLEPGFAFPGRVTGLFEQERITMFPAVPTIYQTLVGLKGLDEREFPHLRCLTNAGAALPAATVAQVRRTFPAASLFLMYGLTEATRVAYLPPDLVDAKPNSVGVAIPGTEIWLEDENGDRAEPGEVGELIVRGPHVMQGYWNSEQDSTVRLRTGRWEWERDLATNDLFRQDEDGHLIFVSRRDDVIKSRGEKVAPREVEEVLVAVEGVSEAAVIGVPDERLGAAVYAHVAAAPGVELDPRELRRECAARLEDYKVPREIVVHEALPRSGNSKVDRKALAALHGDPS